MKTKPYVLSIAGFDPSNGAGLSADVKAMEFSGVYGLSVCSANTVQNDIEFKACHWTPFEIMEAQLKLLFNRFEINWVKIGVVENWKVLFRLIQQIKSYNSNVKFVLDPVLKATSSFDFHKTAHETFYQDFENVLDQVFLITPNYSEIELLYDKLNVEETIFLLNERTNVLLKGGHDPKEKGTDQLYLMNGEHYSILPDAIKIYEKHGSGCVLSSVITSYLAQGYEVVEACSIGKEYIERFLNSNSTLLGYHG